MSGKHPQISATPQAKGAKSSAAQKRFNSLLKKIETHRATLASWSAVEQDYTRLWAEEFWPVIEQTIGAQLELLRFLDQVGSQVKLGKKDQQTLTGVICDLAEGLINESNPHNEEIKAIFARHSGEDFDEMQREELDFFRASLQEAFDVELPDAKQFNTEEELAEFLFEQMSNKADAQEQSKESPKQSAHQRRQEEDLAKGSQSVREIYRKLASALHPDRETDEQERIRKTDLMQRVNTAYADKDLLSLLQLQLEIEQIDPNHITHLPQERIKHYNQVLAEQVMELEDEISMRNAMFNNRFSFDPYETTKPATALRKCSKLLTEIKVEFIELESDLGFLQATPKNIKHWLREERDRLDSWLEDDGLDDLFR